MFEDSAYECNRMFLNCFRFLVFLCTTTSLTIFVIYLPFEYAQTYDGPFKLHLCTGSADNNEGGYAIIAMSFADLFFSGITLLIFVLKLRKLAHECLEFDETSASTVLLNTSKKKQYKLLFVCVCVCVLFSEYATVFWL